MGKLYTVIGTLCAIKELLDCINLTFLHNDVIDPQNLFTNYNTLDTDTKDIIHFLSCWVGLCKFGLFILLLASVISTDYNTRLVSCLGCIMSNCVVFIGVIPAADTIHHLLSMELVKILKVVNGLVLGPLFVFCFYMEYQEMKIEKKKEKKV